VDSWREGRAGTQDLVQTEKPLKAKTLFPFGLNPPPVNRIKFYFYNAELWMPRR